MPDEGNPVVAPDAATPAPEGDKPASGQESVEYSKYIGVKEMLTKAEAREAEVKGELEAIRGEASASKAKVIEHETTVKDLEGQITTLKSSVGDPEELRKVQGQLAEAEGKLLSSKRTEIIQKYGVAEDAIKDYGETQLELFVKGLETARGQSNGSVDTKPKTDLGEGSRGENATAKSKYETGFAALHPQES